MILEGKAKTDKDAAKKLYNLKPNSTFSQLKKRLKEDILSFLLYLPSDNKNESPFLSAEITARKLLIQGKVLFSRGLSDEAVSVFRKSMMIAERYELVDLKIPIYDAMRTHADLKSDTRSYADYGNRLKETFRDQEDLLKAKEYNHVLTTPEISSRPNSGNNNREISILDKMKSGAARSSSKNIRYWYYTSAVQCYVNKRELDKAYSYCLRLLNLVEQEPACSSRSNKAGVNLELAKILIRLERYDQAIERTKKAIKLLHPGIARELYAWEVLFLAHFGNNDFHEAGQVISKASKYRQIKANSQYPGKWSFLQANLNFVQGRHNESLHTLNTNNGNNGDGNGWLLGCKILEMLNIIELQEYTWLDFKMESFRKLLQRLKQGNFTRCKGIYMASILSIAYNQNPINNAILFY